MNNNRTKQFILNAISAMGYQVLVMLAGFITPKVMIVGYGSEINGLISSILQFIAYFNLLEAGLAAATVYSLYDPLSRGNHQKINSILLATRNYYYKSGWIFTLLTAGLALLYPVFIQVKMMGFAMQSLLVLLLGASGALEFFVMAKYRALLTADQKNYIVSMASGVSLILTTVIIALCGYLGVHVVIMRALALLPIVVRGAILFLYVRYRYPYVNYSGEPDNDALNKRWDALYLDILGTTQRGTPLVLATMFTSLVSISIYTVYNMVVGAVGSILGIFTSGLPAAFGQMIAHGETETLQKTQQQFEFAYYSLIGWAYAVMMVMLLPFIQLYTATITDANYSVPLLGILMVLDGMLYNLKTPQGMLVISAGLYRETCMQSTVQALLIIVVGALLAPTYGFTGIVTGSIVANAYRTIDLLFFIPKNVTHLPIGPTFWRQIRCLCILGIGILLSIRGHSIVMVSYWQWMQYAVIVSLFFAFLELLFAIVFDRPQLCAVWNRGVSMLRGHSPRRDG